MSQLSAFRRVGGQLAAPIEFCQRMDGSVGVFSRVQLRVPRGGARLPIMALPMSSTLMCRRRHCFAPARRVWSHVFALTSTINAPWYFEVTGDKADTSVDEQQTKMDHAAAALKERKWVESAAALFVASCLVRGENPAAAAQQQAPVLSPAERFVAWTYCPQNHIAQSPLTERTPASIEEVHLRFRTFQMRALLESCLLDAVASAPKSSAELLFGAEVARAGVVLLNEPISRAVEIATSGAVFDAPVLAASGPQLSGRRQSVFAPFLSSVATAADEAPNCRVVVHPKTGLLVLELTRSVRAGEELLKSV